ncbi:hypothetical protein P8452_71942 [Trifolium repens]|nr:hypothetical protein P8452_71942 [Trifolium repens]
MNHTGNDLRLSSINAFSLVNLTEHMLLYANEKNLVEDSYSKYITEVVTRVTKVLIIYGGCQSIHATFYGRFDAFGTMGESKFFALTEAKD